MNPYAPPNTRVADPPPKPGSPTKAVSLGLLVDMGGTMALGIAIGFVYSVQLAASGKTAEEIEAAVLIGITTGLGFVILLAIGCAFSVLGGYVCARISRRTDYRLGFVMGAISVVAGLLLAWTSYSPVEHILLAGLNVACILGGVKFGILRTEGSPLARHEA